MCHNLITSAQILGPNCHFQRKFLDVLMATE